jgi:hypothetical protein
LARKTPQEATRVVDWLRVKDSEPQILPRIGFA